MTFKDIHIDDSYSDMKKLKIAVLKQSMDDYVKLQHYRYRSKKYLEESFLYAVCVFFDPTYTFLYFFNDNELNMSSKEFIASALNINIKNLNPMQNYLKNESIRYWNKKYMKTFTIPSYLVFQGIVYNILMSEKENKICYKKNEIYLNKKQEGAGKVLISLFTELVDKENKLRLTNKQKDDISESFYSLLKMNRLYLDE